MQAIIDTIAKVKLSRGSHETRAQGMCVMEVVAFVAGEWHSDRPDCACPVITQVAIYANDRYLPEIEQELTRRVLLLAGSVADREVTQQRLYTVLNYVLRDAMVNGVVPPAAKEIFASLPELTGPEQLPELQRVRDILVASGKTRLMLYVQPMRDICSTVRHNTADCAAIAAMRLLNLANAKPNMLALLDQLLAIGATQPATPTPAMKMRIGMLAADADTALAVCD